MNTMRRLLPILLALLAIVSCAEKPVNITLEISATLFDKPLAGAKVSVDGESVGVTDENGRLQAGLARLRGHKGRVKVVLDTPDMKAKPWEGEYSVAMDEKSDAVSVALDAKLLGFVTVVVTSGGNPLPDASIRLNKKDLGKTDAVGEFEYAFDSWPDGGMTVTVSKDDYVADKLKIEGVSGTRIAVDLFERAIIHVKTVRDENGRNIPIAGASVWLDGTEIGATDDGGNFVYRHKGAHGKDAKLMIKVSDHVPSSWQGQVHLAGKSAITRFFFPEQATPVRMGIYEFVSNTANVDIKEVIARIENKFADTLREETAAFDIIKNEELRKLIANAKTNIDKLKHKGWQQKSLASHMDVLVLGSVSKDDSGGFFIEVNMFRSDGKLIMSHVAQASGDSNWRIGRAINDIVENIVERYPFEAMITAISGNEYSINIGKKMYPVAGDDVFSVLALDKDASGRITGESDIGTLKVDSRKAKHTVMVEEGLAKDKKPQVGDKVVRLDSAQQKTSNYVSLSVKGGVDGSRVPLSGVNVYVDKKWIGVSDMGGKIDIPARIGKDVDVVLYRHGFKQVAKTIETEKKGQLFEFAMDSFNSNLKMASDPNGAKVYVDEQGIGNTPLPAEYPVPLGFHTVRLSKGGDYRDWEEVIEFNKHEEDFTGSNKVVLFKDYLKIGSRAYESSDVDAAINAYRSATKEHPDFAEAHHRLARMYMDEKGDYDAAIGEFEAVIEVPEVKQLILKQYAVVYTNLGHAYFAKGEKLQETDQDGAARYFAKAVSVLGKARENARFFPNENYDEIIHDTYYYLAVSYHNLYMLTKNEAVKNNAELAWQQYFDFFPTKLEGREEFMRIKEAARLLWDQIKDHA